MVVVGAVLMMIPVATVILVNVQKLEAGKWNGLVSCSGTGSSNFAILLQKAPAQSWQVHKGSQKSSALIVYMPVFIANTRRRTQRIHPRTLEERMASKPHMLSSGLGFDFA